MRAYSANKEITSRARQSGDAAQTENKQIVLLRVSAAELRASGGGGSCFKTGPVSTVVCVSTTALKRARLTHSHRRRHFLRPRWNGGALPEGGTTGTFWLEPRRRSDASSATVSAPISPPAATTATTTTTSTGAQQHHHGEEVVAATRAVAARSTTSDDSAAAAAVAAVGQLSPAGKKEVGGERAWL